MKRSLTKRFGGKGALQVKDNLFASNVQHDMHANGNRKIPISVDNTIAIQGFEYGNGSVNTNQIAIARIAEKLIQRAWSSIILIQLIRTMMYQI